MRTVTSILKSFNKTIKQLEELAERERRDIESNTISIMKLEESNNIYRSEQLRAEKIIVNIKTLLGEDETT